MLDIIIPAIIAGAIGIGVKSMFGDPHRTPGGTYGTSEFTAAKWILIAAVTFVVGNAAVPALAPALIGLIQGGSILAIVAFIFGLYVFVTKLVDPR